MNLFSCNQFVLTLKLLQFHKQSSSWKALARAFAFFCLLPSGSSFALSHRKKGERNSRINNKIESLHNSNTSTRFAVRFISFAARWIRSFFHFLVVFFLAFFRSCLRFSWTFHRLIVFFFVILLYRQASRKDKRQPFIVLTAPRQGNRKRNHFRLVLKEKEREKDQSESMKQRIAKWNGRRASYSTMTTTTIYERRTMGKEKKVKNGIDWIVFRLVSIESPSCFGGCDAENVSLSTKSITTRYLLICAMDFSLGKHKSVLSGSGSRKICFHMIFAIRSKAENESMTDKPPHTNDNSNKKKTKPFSALIAFAYFRFLQFELKKSYFLSFFDPIVLWHRTRLKRD